MTQLQAIRCFLSMITDTKVIISRRRDEWGMYIQGNVPTIIIPRDPNEEGEDFRNNFISRCPIAKNYMDVTISILHEMGHYFTRNDFLDFDPTPYANYKGIKHFEIPDEIAATDWAIQWLENHEPLAMAFEKLFRG